MLLDHTLFKHIQIKTSQDAADILSELHKEFEEFDRDKETLIVIGLTRRHTIKYIDLTSMGSISGTIAEPREIFRMAIHKAVGGGIILAHNHPSGNMSPSESDIRLTKKIKEAGRILEIKLLDHIIFTEEGHYSFANGGAI
jgi:DNA repair protein RadC